MFANQIGLMPAHPRTAPPPWVVLLVKCCVAGILTFPLGVPLLLAGAAALGVADSFGRAVFFAAVILWGAMFVLAQYLTTVYPPVPRR
jgi:hypothetical protein